jgi:hypothetical protein
VGKLVLDKSGDLRKGIFYRFDISLDDSPIGEQPTHEWVVVPRTPTDDELEAKGEETYIYLHVYRKDHSEVEIKECPADSSHVTQQYFTQFEGEAFGGKRVSPLIPAADPGLGPFGLSDELYGRLRRLHVRGARIDTIDLKEHITDEKLKGYWALQFVGKIMPRILRFVDARNACPFCGKTKLLCEACGGDWNGTCKVCGKVTVVFEDQHGGPDDRRLRLERHPWASVLEGKTWDGSDLVSSYTRGKCYASKRFIDWLLRIHAAPFYAEPVYFCVDGMNDQQKKWFDDLQKPFEV